MNVTAMHAGFLIAVLIAAGFTATAAIPAPAADKAARAELLKHINLVRYFPCQIPQNRTFVIEDLLNSTLFGSDGVVHPRYTVIRTCDCYTGICGGNNGTCGPKETETVTVHIKVTPINNPSKSRYAKLDVKHHKTCECRDKPTTNASEEPRVILTEIEQ